MNGEDEYLETKVMTARPHQLHLMVIDGAIRFALQAKEALNEQDVEAAHFALNTSRGFVAELISGLDPKHAPEIVDRLKGLFVFAYRNLVEADLRHDPQRIGAAIRVLKMHRETWVALSETLQQQAADQTAEIKQRSWTG